MTEETAEPLLEAASRQLLKAMSEFEALPLNANAFPRWRKPWKR